MDNLVTTEITQDNDHISIIIHYNHYTSIISVKK